MFRVKLFYVNWLNISSHGGCKHCHCGNCKGGGVASSFFFLFLFLLFWSLGDASDFITPIPYRLVRHIVLDDTGGELDVFRVRVVDDASPWIPVIGLRFRCWSLLEVLANGFVCI